MSEVFAGEAEVEAIGRAFLDRTLPKPRWNHAGHLAAAVWIMRRCPELVAERDMPELIRAYNEATGVPNSDTRGYHATITLATLRGVRAALAAQPPGAALHQSLNAILASPFGGSRWTKDYWTEALLMSPAARRAWVEPDIRPLPF
jgi:hypothetical protein